MSEAREPAPEPPARRIARPQLIAWLRSSQVGQPLELGRRGDLSASREQRGGDAGAACRIEADPALVHRPFVSMPRAQVGFDVHRRQRQDGGGEPQALRCRCSRRARRRPVQPAIIAAASSPSPARIGKLGDGGEQRVALPRGRARRWNSSPSRRPHDENTTPSGCSSASITRSIAAASGNPRRASRRDARDRRERRRDRAARLLRRHGRPGRARARRRAGRSADSSRLLHARRPPARARCRRPCKAGPGCAAAQPALRHFLLDRLAEAVGVALAQRRQPQACRAAG